MGSSWWVSGFCLWLCVLGLSSVSVSSQPQTIEGTININGENGIGKIDDDFICATLDWWPPEKCDYGVCPWGQASLLNLDLSNKTFFNAIKAFSPMKIRLGGSTQDQVIYDTEDNKKPCLPFVRNTSEMFGFSHGCLPMKRWDELNSFFKSTRANIVFGRNALIGRSVKPKGTTTGDWDSSNAESFIRYTVGKNYPIAGWELGNELCGSGVGTRIEAAQYATDTIELRRIVEKIYNGTEPKPLIISPGGFYEADWFSEFLVKASNSVDVVTHHIYDLGPGVDPHLIDKIVNATYLNGESVTFKSLRQNLKSARSPAVAWVGEAGGAYNSGRNLTSNTFVYSFWYLDQLGMSAAYDTRSYCRQSLIGGNYGLLDTQTFVPNPDYYSALLWHRLMGTYALSTSFSGSKNIRAYAHCARQSKGVTVLLINLDKTDTVLGKVDFNGTWSFERQHVHHHPHRGQSHHHHHSHEHQDHEVGQYERSRKSLPRLQSEKEREEYHLTPQGGYLQSRTMLLNGKALNVDSSGNIPALEPVRVSASKPIVVRPHSIVFAHMPYVTVPACQ